jgi:hypothetical protein
MAEERDRQRGQSQADQRENEVTFPHEFDKLGTWEKVGMASSKRGVPCITSHCVVSGSLAVGDREKLDTPPQIFSFTDAENPDGNSESAWVLVLQ